MSIRLLFLTAETCPTFRADVQALFGKYLPRHGVRSDVVSGRTPGHESAQVWDGGDAYLCEVAGGQAKKHIKMLLHGMWQIFRADRTRYQAIQVRDMPVLGLIGLTGARLKRLPFAYWMSYPMSEGQIELARERGLSAGLMKFLFPWLRGRVGRFLIYRVVLPRADHVFVQSERMQEDLAALGLDASRMTPVPMGVDLEEMNAAEIQPADDPRLVGRRVLVYLGSLDRPRRIEILFEMLALVREQIPEVLLVIAGDTEDEVHRGWLRQQADKFGVTDSVIWTGWLPMKAGWRYVRAAELGLSPIPRGDLLDCASPTKLPEYLALGVPAVCNDNPDQAKVISESGAGVCVPYTAKEFARGVLDILQRERHGKEDRSSRGADYVKAERSYERISLMVAETYRKWL